MISYIVCHAGMICASTVLLSTRTREFALTQPLYSDARLRLCWVLALFAVLVRESFLLSRTVGHSPYRLKSSKSALCKHSSAFYPHSRIRADAAALFGRSPSALLGVGFICRACPGKLSAFPDCRAFALSSSSLKQNFVQALLSPTLANPRFRAPYPASQDICSLITQEKEMSASQPLPFLLRLLYNIPLYLHNYYFTESFS